MTSIERTSAVVVKDSGPGEHVFKVTAVNGIGQGAAASATIKLDKLSKPRKAKAVKGAAGGQAHRGREVEATGRAGGFAITKYKIAVYKANGKKVDIKVVKATRLKYLFKLKPGRYYFKVKARNVDRWGPWSKPTDLVRPR